MRKQPAGPVSTTTNRGQIFSAVKAAVYHPDGEAEALKQVKLLQTPCLPERSLVPLQGGCKLLQADLDQFHGPAGGTFRSSAVRAID